MCNGELDIVSLANLIGHRILIHLGRSYLAKVRMGPRARYGMNRP